MKKHGRERAEEWEKALVEVGRIKGRELKKTGFVEFSNKFRAEIALKLRVKQKYAIKHFVEMPDEVEELLKLLEIGSADVRFVGMYGMGGVGKTTLAKNIVNRISSSFDSCSFLENIREESSCKGLESLRTKLLQDLNPKASEGNMNVSDNWNDRMARCVRMKSVLIVLDDVGERSHIEELVGGSISFGSRSRIIITTRDQRALLMNVAEASSSNEGSAKMSTTCITTMEVKGMNPEQAMQLFSRHAFGRDYPPEDYESLSNDVISISGGLPLALEVIGSLLYGMSIEAWKDKVTLLKTIPAEDVQKKLMISYDTLEDNVKEIYLDIACFFIHEDKSNPIYMWEACGFGPNWAVQILLSMSLIKITDDDKFWMHDQLRDLGREIVRIKGNNSPTFREGSRIQTYEDALSVQKRNKEKDVVGFRVRGIDDNLIEFSNLECLRFLQVLEIRKVHHRKFWQLSTNLTWLSLMLNKPKLISPAGIIFYSVYRNTDSSYLMKLAVLDLSESDITDSWDGWILIQELRRLKVLNLTKCKNLTRTPNFSKMEALEKLILYRCIRLTKIDKSIGKLRRLKYLNLQYCYKLTKLPEEVGNIEDLVELDLSSTNVTVLPESIGDLTKLQVINLRSTPVNVLPATIAQLSLLQTLNLSECDLIERVSELPRSLTDLKLNVCSLRQDLDLSMLNQLRELTLDDRELAVLSLPDKLDKLPFKFDAMKMLSSLEILDLDLERNIFLPAEFSQLTRLKSLKLSCSNLICISPFPSSLQSLTLRKVGTKTKLSCLSNLNNLSELELNNCWMLGGIDNLGVDKLESLIRLSIYACYNIYYSPNLSRLKHLEELDLLLCRNIVEIPGLSTVVSLKKLDIRYCDSLERLESMKNLTSLSYVKIEKCSNFRGIQGLEELSVSQVYINQCKCTNIDRR